MANPDFDLSSRRDLLNWIYERTVAGSVEAALLVRRRDAPLFARKSRFVKRLAEFYHLNQDIVNREGASPANVRQRHNAMDLFEALRFLARHDAPHRDVILWGLRFSKDYPETFGRVVEIWISNSPPSLFPAEGQSSRVIVAIAENNPASVTSREGHAALIAAGTLDFVSLPTFRDLYVTKEQLAVLVALDPRSPELTPKDVVAARAFFSRVGGFGRYTGHLIAGYFVAEHRFFAAPRRPAKFEQLVRRAAAADESATWMFHVRDETEVGLDFIESITAAIMERPASRAYANFLTGVLAHDSRVWRDAVRRWRDRAAAPAPAPAAAQPPDAAAAAAADEARITQYAADRVAWAYSRPHPEFKGGVLLDYVSRVAPEVALVPREPVRNVHALEWILRRTHETVPVDFYYPGVRSVVRERERASILAAKLMLARTGLPLELRRRLIYEAYGHIF